MKTLDDLPDESLVDIENVIRMVAMRRTWIYEKVRAGRFPAPLKIGTASRWRLGDVRRWLAALATAPGEGA
jgi:predicted DNA-binding transcriptional regulator AlpA